MRSRKYGAPRLTSCDEIEVRTLQRGLHLRVKLEVLQLTQNSKIARLYYDPIVLSLLSVTVIRIFPNNFEDEKMTAFMKLAMWLLNNVRFNGP